MTSEAPIRTDLLFSDALDSRLGTLAVLVITLAFYLYTLQPSLSWGDGTRLQREAITGESFILAELVDVPFAPDPFPFARLGVAAWDHPLYVVVGHTLVQLLPGVDRLWLVNLLSAIFGAAAITTLFWLCYRHTRSLMSSLYASLALSVAHTFWFHATTPEVYTLFAFLLLLSLALCDRFEQTGHPAALAGSAFALGLGASNHLLALLALPAAAFYLLLSGRSRWMALRPHKLALTAMAFLAGFSLYLIQLARMLRTFSLSSVVGPVVGTTFLRGLLEMPPPFLLVSLLTYLMYLFFQFGPLGLGLGIYGFWKGSLDDAPLRKKAISFFIIYALFGVLYRVSDQFAFFLGSYLFWAMAMAMGAARLAKRLSDQGRRWLAAALALAILVMPPFYSAAPGWLRSFGVTDQSFGIPPIGTGVRDGLNFYINPNKHGDDAAYRFGRETMESLPPGAVVIAQWYTDTDEYFVLRYFSVVEGLRPDVELVGWPREEPIDFDSSLAVRRIEAELSRGRPVYLASLSEAYYRAATLVEQYCIVPEHNLYRIYPGPPDGAQPEAMICVTDAQP